MLTFNDPAAIASHILDHTHNHVRMALPLGLGKANTIVNALTEAALADRTIRLEVFTALTLERPVPGSELEKRFLEPAMDRLFGDYPALRYAQLLHQRELPDNIEVSEFFLLAGQWLHVDRVQGNYICANYTDAYGFLVARKPNVVVQLLAREADRFSLSCNTDITADLISDRAAGKIDFLLAGEVNSSLPFMAGEAAEITESDVGCLLDDPGSDFELFSSVKQPVDLVEHAIGLHVSGLVADGGTLQVGIGSIGDAVANALMLRHRDNDAWRAGMQANPFGQEPCHREIFDAGLYAVTEMLVDGVLQLFEADIVKREVDGAAIHAGFFVESRSFYEALRHMPEKKLSKIVMKPVSFTNALYGNEERKRAARTKARFINNAMLATLTGAVTSDGTGDGQVVSGVGGQFDFVAQAFALDDARSIITVKATRQKNGETVSNIFWNYPHATIPRHLKDIVVTQYGVADLRGKSDSETIAAMLAVTDSRFQDDLLERAQDEGKIDRAYSIPDEHRFNLPDRLSAWLRPMQQDGSLQTFPFGTDFTATEQTLLPALAVLKDTQHSKTGLLKLAWCGLRTAPTRSTQECLRRMGLDAPSSATAYVYSLLVRGALVQSGQTI